MELVTSPAGLFSVNSVMVSDIHKERLEHEMSTFDIYNGVLVRCHL
jgi:hypothetical protein